MVHASSADVINPEIAQLEPPYTVIDELSDQFEQAVSDHGFTLSMH